MKCIHLLRKSCSEGTVAANVLRWGTGALNIDATRISTSDNLNGGAYSGGVRPVTAMGLTGVAGGTSSMLEAGGGRLSPDEFKQPTGRWPANLLLSCSHDCDGDTHAPSCPCAALDTQSGVTKSTGGRIGNAQGAYANQGRTGWSTAHEAGDPGFGDTGGASRYFKQFTTTTTSTSMNTDLADYLRALISPEERTLTTTEGGECVYLHIADPDTFPWGEHGDASVHGLTVESTTLAGQEVWLPEALRVLKPGGHLLLAAPDEEPTGHTGACLAEDAGFEVRDAILWAYGEGAGDRLHYTAKAARAEREAGLFDSEFEYGQQDESRKEGNPGGDNPRNRGLTKRKNVHPTVKSVEIMTKLLHDVPKDCGPVVDPFLGSGTTLLACIETGHDGIGIEREREYIEIADARVRHRDYETAGWNRAHIVSDVVPEAPADGDGDKQEQSLDDFFGL